MTYEPSYRRILGRMGYYNYQDGLIYHHINQEGEWGDHLLHCRNFILKALEYHKPSKVTVLGSGWMLDLPIAEIVEQVPVIELIDIIHPPDVIEQVRNFKNVKLIEMDITGGLVSEVWQKAGKYSYIRKLRTLENIQVPEFKFPEDPGMIISLNILTQLESLPLTYIKKRAKIREEEFAGFRNEIQRKHIDILKRYNFVLLTDIEEVITDKSGVSTNIPTLLTELPGNRIKEEWTWNFDQAGGELYNSRSQFRIIGLIN